MSPWWSFSRILWDFQGEIFFTQSFPSTFSQEGRYELKKGLQKNGATNLSTNLKLYHSDGPFRESFEISRGKIFLLSHFLPPLVRKVDMNWKRDYKKTVRLISLQISKYITLMVLFENPLRFPGGKFFYSLISIHL